MSFGFKTRVDENGHIKWGLVVPLFGILIVLLPFIGQYAIMGKDVQETVNDVEVLDNRIYAIEKD